MLLTQAQMLIALACAVVAVLHQIDTDPAAWAASEQGSIYASREQLQRFITNPDSVEKVRNTLLSHHDCFQKPQR